MKHGLVASPVTPSAARLTESLRDIGYDFSAAVADLIDNSISAGATTVKIITEYDGADSRIYICDDGNGMSINGAIESLRFGTRRQYGLGDLGRYGLGLKTASLSQGRSVTVVSRNRTGTEPHSHQLDLDIIVEHDDWILVKPTTSSSQVRARQLLAGGKGTVIIWEKLDRILPPKQATGGWAKRRFESLRHKLKTHLSMVFHRFLAGENGAKKLTILVDGDQLKSWDPFQRMESETKQLDDEVYEVMVGDRSGKVELRRFILPSKNNFSSLEAFEAASGPDKWNR